MTNSVAVINAERLSERLAELARDGAVGATGVSRTVYSTEWLAATARVARWAELGGLETQRDAVGNIWAVLRGTESGPSIVTGSHIDSQAPGGQYDGALGVVGAIEALISLRERFGQPRRTVEAVAFCEEESSRFPNANFWGSRAVTGRILPEDVEQVVGYDGVTIGAAMREVGLDPERIDEARRHDISAFVELHIEQGPILEQAGIPVAIVEAITGIRHSVVTLRGAQNHAGAFPMDLRFDPMAGFAEIAATVIDTAHRIGRPAVTTVGRVQVKPNFPAVIPAEVEFTIDARHPDPVMRDRLYELHEETLKTVAARRGLSVDWRSSIDHPPCICDPDLVSALTAAAESAGIPSMVMPSGAAHDAQQMARIAPVAMIFVRSRDGRSHTPDEYSSPEDCVTGVRVLAEALHRLIY